jgi:hypothetical protein
MRKMRVSWTLRAWRSPLRRRVDRIEAAVLCVLAVLFLIIAPLLATWAARVGDAAGLREMRADASLRRVHATLLENASAGQPVPAGWAVPDGSGSLVRAKWDSPSGRARTGVLDVPAGTRASQRVTVWVTKSGKLAEPPVNRADVQERVVLTVLGTEFGFVALLLVAAAVVRAAANRRRMADWGRAWAAFSPRSSQSW